MAEKPQYLGQGRSRRRSQHSAAKKPNTARPAVLEASLLLASTPSHSGRMPATPLSYPPPSPPSPPPAPPSSPRPSTSTTSLSNTSSSSSTGDLIGTITPGLLAGHYAGGKWNQPPSASELPLPPERWVLEQPPSTSEGSSSSLDAPHQEKKRPGNDATRRLKAALKIDD